MTVSSRLSLACAAPEPASGKATATSAASPRRKPVRSLMGSPRFQNSVVLAATTVALLQYAAVPRPRPGIRDTTASRGPRCCRPRFHAHAALGALLPMGVRSCPVTDRRVDHLGRLLRLGLSLIHI